MDHYERVSKALEVLRQIMTEAWKDGVKIEFNLRLEDDKYVIKNLDVWQKMKKH